MVISKILLGEEVGQGPLQVPMAQSNILLLVSFLLDVLPVTSTFSLSDSEIGVSSCALSFVLTSSSTVLTLDLLVLLLGADSLPMNELYPNSRFEIFSMNVSVLHSQFDEGYVTGRVTFVDKCRLSNSDGWVGLDKKNNCYVSYFDREWYNAVTIYNGSYVPLGNTSSVHSVPFSSSIEVALMIKATSKDRDQSYIIYNGNAGADLTKFWDGDLNTMCGTIKRESKDGRILLDFVAIKDAVDTTMELTFNPVKDVRLRGSITASYGKDILGDVNFLGQYTARIFKADSTTKYRCKKPHSLPLHKSAMAVPVNGCLRMHANLVDADTERRIVDKEEELRESESSNGVSRWTLECDEGFFELTVKWVHQARRGWKVLGTVAKWIERVLLWLLKGISSDTRRTGKRSSNLLSTSSATQQDTQDISFYLMSYLLTVVAASSLAGRILTAGLELLGWEYKPS
ncbi:hypothetical protein Tco_0451935 [Tanacetum coccineum]